MGEKGKWPYPEGAKEERKERQKECPRKNSNFPFSIEGGRSAFSRRKEKEVPDCRGKSARCKKKIYTLYRPP